MYKINGMSNYCELWILLNKYFILQLNIYDDTLAVSSAKLINKKIFCGFIYKYFTNKCVDFFKVGQQLNYITTEF